jgi:membrane protein implicated in regulation of membrane protease activity
VCLLPIELVPPRKKRLAPRIIILGLVLVAIFALIPMLRSALRAGVGIAAGTVYVLAYIFAVVMLPLMFFALMRFAYLLFLRPYLRAWHINRIRNQRYMKDVIRRGQSRGPN